jgi:sphingomyelin phosphodiesterase
VTDYPAGPYGDHNCDSPLDLEESLYSAIEQIVPDASFTLFTGDIVEGIQWLTTNKEIVTDIDSCYSHMRGLDLVYGAVGNHEANPVNSFPPAGVHTLTNQSNQYMYDTLAENWIDWIGPEAAANTASRYGAYSVLHPRTSLRIISFNTMFYMKENFWLYTPVMSWDPSSQFSWLISELQSAEDARERVYLIGHMPMGQSDSLYDYSAYFDQIVQRYDATIAALFFGHTHRDQWEIAYSDYNDRTYQTATAMSYIAPALTPTSGNPTFRVYSVDPVTFGVLDYTVYYANMSLPHYQSQGPTWEKYYSVKETYGLLLSLPYTDPSAELTPAFWHNVTQLFIDDDAIFQDYIARKQRGWNPMICSGICKTQEICGLRSSRSQYACFPEDSPVSVKKRSVGGHHQHDVCPGSVALPFLKSMGVNFDILRKVVNMRREKL